MRLLEVSARSMVLATLGVVLLGAQGSSRRPVNKVDRMWVVGAPALDAAPMAGIYIWISEGRFAFAVVPAKRAGHPVHQWTVRATEPLRWVDRGDCKVAARGKNSLVLAARPRRAIARCAVKTEGELTVSRFRAGRRAAPAFVGPLARRAASSVRIGRY